MYRTMPHPPQCIWVHPRNQSLQPLYLSLLQLSRVIQIEEIIYDTHPPQQREAHP